jgi:hypothetical protein
MLAWKKWHNAEVRWFDNRSGEGFIRVNDKSIYVHWSAIVKNLNCDIKNCHKQPKEVWTVLFKKQKVKVRIIEDSHYTQIAEVKGMI